MSGGDESDSKNLPVVQQPVGYRQPPVEHRFKKGRSGNPAGRPKGRRNKPERRFNPADEPTAALILEEAYRPVAIREGDRVVELPAIQAVMRAMSVSAMKGNRLAQKTMTEIVQQVEAAKGIERVKAAEGAIEYKRQWSREIDRCRRQGLPEPQPLPHPDDISIDLRTLEVRTEGPMSIQEKAYFEERIQRLQESQKEVTYFAAQYRKARSPEQKQRWLDEWHFEQRLFDIINDSLPGRYKIELNDRSLYSGASKPGEALKEIAEDKKLPRGKRKWSAYYE